VTSIAELMGRDLDIATVLPAVTDAFAAVFERQITTPAVQGSARASL